MSTNSKPALVRRLAILVALSTVGLAAQAARLEVSTSNAAGSLLSYNLMGELTFFEVNNFAPTSTPTSLDLTGLFDQTLVGSATPPAQTVIHARLDAGMAWTNQTLSITDNAEFGLDLTGAQELRPIATIGTNLTFDVAIVGEGAETVGTPVQLHWNLAVSSQTWSLPPDMSASSGGSLNLNYGQLPTHASWDLSRGVGNSAGSFIASVGDVLHFEWAASGGYQTDVASFGVTDAVQFQQWEDRAFNLTLSPVPEPASWSLLLAGAFGLALRRFGRRAQS